MDDRWNEGFTNAWKLWEEIVPLGYQGSYQRVRARADVWSYADTRTAAGPHRATHPSRKPHPDGNAQDHAPS